MTVNQIRARLERIERRRLQFERKWEQLGRLSRHEVWRHAYLARPYLVGAPEDRAAERFCNIFMNVVEFGRDGKLTPTPWSESDELFQLFAHLLEEYGSRTGKGPPDELIGRARTPIAKYFESGTPIGFTMFQSYVAPSTPILVKYGKRQFLESLLRSGELRLANAGLYNDMGFLDAVRDDETSRTFFIPTYKERLAGETHLDFQGHRFEFNDDDIVLPLVFDDYYLFSLCESIHHRMPTDFHADAAIVIRDPMRFKQQLISTFLARFPDWVAMEGRVTYYDPYRDYTKVSVPQMAKHFGYAYQREVRVAFRPRRKLSTSLEPLFLSIGPMTEYSDMVFV